MGQRLKYIILFLASVGIATVGVTSCIDEISEKTADLGIEATAEQRNDAINEAFQGISLSNATLHSRVLYENNQRVEMGSVIRTSSVENELYQIKNYDDGTGYIFKQTAKTYDMDSNEETDSKTSTTDALIIPKNPPTNTPFRAQALSSPMSLIKQAAIQTLGTDCDGIDETDKNGIVYDCLRYFNLRYELRQTAPPAAVRARPNCMGIPNCQMTIRFLAYDEVKWKNQHAVEKIHLEAEIAPDVPDIMYMPNGNGWSYLPPVYSICERFLTPINKQKYLVALCTVLRDFELP
jgi:hypothetical protein